jgi:hypothetical protein
MAAASTAVQTNLAEDGADATAYRSSAGAVFAEQTVVAVFCGWRAPLDAPGKGKASAATRRAAQRLYAT